MTTQTSTLRQTARAFAIALLMGSTFLGYSAQAAEPAAVQATTQAAPAAEQPAAQEATRTETQSYSVREAQAEQALKNFQGGDTTVIVGSSAVVLVLLIVLIIVLI